jgi:hypothetical protein
VNHSARETGLTEAQETYKHDRKRLRSNKAALLDLLQDRHWHPNYELARVGGLSFNSYLYQLRLSGWQIDSRRVYGGVWEQRLVGRRDRPSPARDGLSKPQQRVVDEFELAVQKAYGAHGLELVRRELSPWVASTSTVAGSSTDRSEFPRNGEPG